MFLLLYSNHLRFPYHYLFQKNQRYHPFPFHQKHQQTYLQYLLRLYLFQMFLQNLHLLIHKLLLQKILFLYQRIHLLLQIFPQLNLQLFQGLQIYHQLYQLCLHRDKLMVFVPSKIQLLC